jgi:cysteine desulfurase family protein
VSVVDLIYFDNAATSFPKAPLAAEAMFKYISGESLNINRSGYRSMYSIEDTVYETRELIAEFFNFPVEKAENVVFTKNITESLNVIIKGLLKPGDHVIVSSMEHNSVMRPLQNLAQNNITFSRIPCTNKGELITDKLHSLVQPNTKAVIITAATNVCGTIFPLDLIGDFCEKHNLFFILDSAQLAGFSKLDMMSLKLHALAFTGHKGLLGPQGIGGFLVDNTLSKSIVPLIEGGTGSLSELEVQPDYMPDKFEAGTPNIAGILGLHASINFLKDIGLEYIRDKELYLTSIFIEKIKNMPKAKLIGLDSIKNRTSTVSLDFSPLDNGEIAYLLHKDYNITTRCGLHCAPNAHKVLGTFPQGTVRFSFGHANTEDEVNKAIDALNKLV